MRKLFLLLTAVVLSITYAFSEISQITYLDENGNRKTTYAEFIHDDQSELVVWGSGTYFVATNTTFSDGLHINGQVRLIIEDGATFTVYSDSEGTPGIRVGSSASTSLDVFERMDHAGRLVAEGGRYAAGIGGAQGESACKIHIYGCDVRATGGEGASAIGGGQGAAASSDIYFADQYTLRDMSAGYPGTIVFYNNGEDVAAKLAGKRDIELEDRCRYTVNYVDNLGASHQVSRAFVVENTSVPVDWRAGWYVVSSNITLSDGAICHGDVNLILSDGAKLTATGGNHHAGIQVGSEGTSLTIYCQTHQTGQLIATGGYFGAGIGGNGDDDNDGAHITIHGGHLTCTGGDGAAGIGGGNWGRASHITIDGGSVTAFAGRVCSAIGSGYTSGVPDASDIFIASSLMLCADNSNPPLTFIEHTSDTDVAQALKGQHFATVRPFMTDFVITFDRQGGVGGTEQLVIDNGQPMPAIQVPTREGYVFRGYYTGIDGGGLLYYQADGTSSRIWTTQENMTLYALWGEIVSYIDADGTTQFKDVRSFITDETTDLNNDWYAVRGADVQTGQLTCHGDVHLILMDGARLTATGNAGIAAGATTHLTIYGQAEQTGQLIATGNYEGAGIGSTFNDSGDITINGGVIMATGSSKGAGIGGGTSWGCGRNITINAGHVTAIGGPECAGIGGGERAGGFDIIINGGVVNATGGTEGAGIGGGFWGTGGSITINGGEVTAAGGDYAAGIGGGRGGGANNITVNGGLIMATGGSCAAGIGGGGLDFSGTCEYVYINGGEITANAGADASGIGAGKDHIMQYIYVSSSLVLKAENRNPPTTEIEHTSAEDLAPTIEKLRYIHIKPSDVPSDLEHVNVNDNVNVNKLLHNGQLLIQRDGRTYNAQGARVNL